MTDEIRNKVVVCANGEDRVYDYQDFNLNFDSSEDEVLRALAPMLDESLNVDIGTPGRWQYKTRKAVNSQNIYLIPNSTAG